ncbi:MAG: condensation domain-containing protein, partial [Clostridiales bacterium]|nr:condensation domain-containing protein [Clostridiales bacterium]
MEYDKKFPLSHNQKSLFFMERLISGKPVYNLSAAIRFGAEIDQAILKESMLDLFACNDALKTVFVTEPAGVFQVIKKDMPFSVFNVEKASEAEIMGMIETEKDRPFDLAEGPLVRAVLYQKAEGCIVLIVMHHIISDFWTFAVLLKDLGYIYSQRVLGSKDYRSRITDKPSYELFVQRQEKILAQKTELADYWRSVLSGELPVLNLSTDRKRPPVQSFSGDRVEWTLSTEDSERIARICKQCGIGKHVFLLSVFQLLLQKYSGQDDILVGTLATGRTSLKLSEITGYFINPVVVRGDLSGDPPFRVFLERIKQSALGAFAHKQYPFDLIVKQLELRRDLSVSPVFQALFAYQTLPHFIGSDAAAISAAALNRSAVFDFEGIAAEYIPLAQHTAQYDISLITAELEEGMGLLLEYNSDLFDPETARRMLKHYETLLRSALDEPEKKLSELEILDSEERDMELCAHNRTDMLCEPLCLHQLIERQAEHTPGSLALIFSEVSLTYREL